MSSSTPFDDLERWLDRLNRQLSDLNERARLPARPDSSSIPMDVLDRGDELLLRADLPGYEREGIDLTWTDDVLHVSADRAATSGHEGSEGEDEDEAIYHRRERRRSVSRSITLPEPVDEDEASATYRDGVLEVRLPKRSASDDAHAIEIG